MAQFNPPRLPDEAVAGLADQLPEVAERCVAAITAEVPGYAGALSGEPGELIEEAVQQALAGFLRLAGGPQGSDPSTPMRPALDGAYALGQGEARSGRSMDALLAAYRVGARVSWRELSTAAVDVGIDAATIARFAELVFAYIDGLSAASVAGHSDELATEGRVRERRRERLAGELLAGREEEVLVTLAERAEWPPPLSLTAVLLPADAAASVMSTLGANCLRAADDLSDADLAVLLVPDLHGLARRRLLNTLRHTSAVVGPTRPWTHVTSSWQRAVKAHELGLATGQTPLDTEDHLADLVLQSDRDALQDLRIRALAPLTDLPPATADRLGETLRSWLLHQGRRDAVAAHLHVHAQTVRYRMTQIRELFGDRLDDPSKVLDILIALQPKTVDNP